MSDAAFILASASTTRAALLRDAGLNFEVRPAAIDERSIEALHTANGDPAMEIALSLATAKATAIAETGASLPVVGADQVMEIGGAMGHKPETMAVAAEQLARLSGKVHFLHTAAVITLPDGTLAWHKVEPVRLAMRSLSAADIAHYLDQVGERALTSVGGYQIDGPGIKLFDDIHGDYFAVLGLPMLPLIKALRDLDVIT
ncbi:MAG: Maf family nucleotide pyrophosphatase [Alphaproteobacteria bacterium]